MTTFLVSLLLLLFHRDRLQRTRTASLFTVLIAIVVALVIIGGNVALNPIAFAYFAAYFLGILACFWAAQNKITLLRWLYWAYDQHPRLHTWSVSKKWGGRLASTMEKLKGQKVCILTKTDEVRFTRRFQLRRIIQLLSRSTISSI
jgi:hypothetical protein